MLFGTFDRYLLREVLLTLAAAIVVLLVLLLSHRLAQYLSQAASGRLAQGSILLLLGLVAVRYLVELIPAAMLLSIMLTLGRLYRDSEMTALSACGLGPGAVYRPLLLLALPLALLLAELSLSLVPTSLQLQYQVRTRAQQEAELWLVRPGTFREIDDGRHVVYVGSLSDNGRRLNDIFVYSADNGGVDDSDAAGSAQPSIITTARSGYQRIDPDTETRFLVLENGRRYQGRAGGGEFDIGSFEQLTIRIDTPAAGARVNKVRALPTETLLDSDDPAYQAEFQRRLSAPLALILLTLLAPLLARANPREGRYGRIVSAILIYAVYANLLGVGQAWLARGLTPQALGLWWVHGLLLLTIGALWWLSYGGWSSRRTAKATASPPALESAADRPRGLPRRPAPGAS